MMTFLLSIVICVLLVLSIYLWKSRLAITAESKNQKNLLNQRFSEMQSENDRLTLALVNTNQGVWDWNLETGEVYLSPMMEKMAGFDQGEWYRNQKLWEDIIHPSQFDEVRKGFEDFLSSNDPEYTCDQQIRTKDGGYIWVRDQGKIVEWDEKGEPFRMIGTYSNIDNEKKVHQQLIEARDEAESAAKAKSKFLSTMSHEIRTPMNGVMGMSQLLSDTKLSAEQRDYVNTINRSGSNLLSIINDILDFSKLDSGKTQLESISFDFERICLECLELFSARASDLTIDLILDYPIESRRHFVGDPARMRQVILNLIGNAVKFTDAGYIQLAVEVVEKDSEYCELSLLVEDTGIWNDNRYN